jgi:TetR/AcrR family transcriptional regulator, regulator of biofilm formation and stress response
MAHIPTDLRRQRFIDAALVVVAQDGVDGATTRRIAEQAGAPVATLHYCFQTKENLLWAVFEQLTELMRDEIGSAAALGQSRATVGAQLLRHAIEWAIARPQANRAQFEIWFWAKRHDPEFAIRIYELVTDTWCEFLGGTRTPRPGTDLESVAHVLVGLVDGLCMQLVSNSDDEATRRKVDVATRMLEAYLG